MSLSLVIKVAILVQMVQKVINTRWQQFQAVFNTVDFLDGW
jgi:hypothetical protein